MSEGATGLAIDETRAGVAFWIHVTPGARSPRIGGTHGDALRIAVTSPPVEGRANAACEHAIAEALSVSRAAVRVPQGSRGRRKRVEVEGAPGALRTRLDELATS